MILLEQCGLALWGLRTPSGQSGISLHKCDVKCDESDLTG